jgi:hypothetical protein
MPVLAFEVYRLERPHEEPAKAQSVGDRQVNFVRVDDTVLDEPKSFSEKRALQSIDHKTVDLFAQPDRRLTDPSWPNRCLSRRQARPSRRPGS